MKKLVIFVLIFVCLAGTVFSATEELEIYSYLYDNAATLTDKLGIMEAIVTLRIQGAGEFYARAFNNLVSQYPVIRDSRNFTKTDKDAADDLAQILAALIGEERYTSCAADLWRAVGAFANPLVKSEALISLGKLQARDYLPQIVKVLTDLNRTPTQDRLAGERIAMGAIISLEKFREASGSNGYLAVFFAATGWYGDRIRNQAMRSLPVIMTDPSEPLSSVIRGAGYPYATKLLALQTVENATIANASKSNVALSAYTEGWKASTSDPRMRQVLLQLRKLSIDMIRRYGIRNDTIYPLLKRSCEDTTQATDINEKMAAVETLGILHSDEAASILSTQLMLLNGKRQNGNLSADENRLIKAIIPALGETGRPSAKAALQSTLSLNYDNDVKNLANAALAKLP
jgi:HEAT repeat protein